MKGLQKAIILRLLPDKLFMCLFQNLGGIRKSQLFQQEKRGWPKVSDFNELGWSFMIN